MCKNYIFTIKKSILNKSFHSLPFENPSAFDVIEMSINTLSVTKRVHSWCSVKIEFWLIRTDHIYYLCAGSRDREFIFIRLGHWKRIRELLIGTYPRLIHPKGVISASERLTCYKANLESKGAKSHEEITHLPHVTLTHIFSPDKNHSRKK